MIFRDNPVLTRELLVNLRSPRAFVLQFALRRVPRGGGLLLLAGGRGRGAAGQLGRGAARLFDLFFLGQFFLVALVAPDVRGREHHRARRSGRPTRCSWPARCEPTTILVGKLLSSLTLPGDPDPVEPAADDPLLPAGRDPALGDRAGLPRPDPGGGDVRPAERGLLELLPPDQLGAGGQLPGHPAAGGRLRGADPDRQRRSRRDFVSIAVLPPWCLAIWTVVAILDQPPAAPPARRRQRGQGRRRRGAGDEVRHRRGHRPRPLPRQAVRPGQARPT